MKPNLLSSELTFAQTTNELTRGLKFLKPSLFDSYCILFLNPIAFLLS